VIVLGRVALALSLVFSLSGVLFLALGVRRDRRDLIRNGYVVVYCFFLSAVVAGAVLLQAFIHRDFGFQYVFENSDPKLSLFYRIAGFWAGQQGSFLLWLLLLAVVTAVIALRNLRECDRLNAAAVMVLSVVSAFFATLMVVDGGSDPFLRTVVAGATPQGLNPLLLHPAMVFHPPALFTGYVGLAVPFAYGVGALILGRADRVWARLAQRWAVFGWAFLSLGIGLGAWWAYVVLGWGGYWGWDPVENTSLIPWLTGTALLHSLTLYGKRGIFKRWALSLAVATFWLTIVATWVTRSGDISSVHAFESRRLLADILTGFMVAIVAASAGLLAWRWRRLASDDQVESLISRDFMYYAANVMLSLFAGALLVATVAMPLWFGRTVGPGTYNTLARPLTVLLLLMVAVCPLLAWRRTAGSALLRHLAFPAAAALISVPLWMIAGFAGDLGGLIGLVVSAFAGASVLQFVYRTARRVAGRDGFPAGLWRALTSDRARSGGIVAHIGMVLIVVGLLGSNVYKIEHKVVLPATIGQETTIKGYTLRFEGLGTSSGQQGAQGTLARFTVMHGGARVGRIAPRLDYYPATQQTAFRAAILNAPWHDLFVAPGDKFDQSGVAIQVDFFPLISLVWIGALALVAGAVVSLWPRRDRVEAMTDDE
jgi:cytochrome c-type biogenesis protein CcmF